MKTQDLVALLAADVTPVDPHIMSKRFSWALLMGVLGSTVLMAIWLGIRPDLAQVVRTALFWFKLAFPLALAGASLWTCTRLARPGAAVGAAGVAVALPIAAVWLVAALMVRGAPDTERAALLLGQTWRVCSRNIACLSIPGLIAGFWAMRGLAPTHLRWAGAACGLLAGATATVVYCLHCPEMGAPFWAIWYLFGMLIPTLGGALLGPYLLRW
ncbi:DUF1109 domain-containing protein [Burkholderia sp. L27(2015)]|uniref:DUF1109 domain-containing protein n=1 Tax=Burkholderia sp. L27(2015) TaxID=1641858 RepID=UPI00131DA078|nr:DUF1109 domain-containing protein [Burkholderia sp. L27(2015)]